MSIRYAENDFHVAHRTGVPEALVQNLNANPAWASWRSIKPSQPQIIYWLDVHKSFLETIGQIDVVTESLIDAPQHELGDAIRESNLLDGTQNLITAAQHHHAIEDQVFFPKFVTLLPRLKDPLEMLDQDHIVLDQAMEDATEALDKLSVANPSRDDVAELYHHAHKLKKIMTRHIRDEEDILMPDVLEVGLEKLMMI